VLYGVAGSCNIADKKNVIKFIRTAAIPELFFVGKNEININPMNFYILNLKPNEKVLFRIQKLSVKVLKFREISLALI
jgi:hypothetical protein